MTATRGQSKIGADVRRFLKPEQSIAEPPDNSGGFGFRARPSARPSTQSRQSPARPARPQTRPAVLRACVVPGSICGFSFLYRRSGFWFYGPPRNDWMVRSSDRNDSMVSNSTLPSSNNVPPAPNNNRQPVRSVGVLSGAFAPVTGPPHSGQNAADDASSAPHF